MRQMAAGKLDVFSLATEVEQFGSNPRRRVSMGLTTEFYLGFDTKKLSAKQLVSMTS